MEIVSGKARGVTLHSPATEGGRPTSVRARKALLDGPGALSGLVFADLFAGVGTVGLEAASRGASSVLFVDSSSASLKTRGRNAEKLRRLGVETDFRILHGSLPALSGRLAAEARPTYIFADPPYEESVDLLSALTGDEAFRNWASDSVLIWELPENCGDGLRPFAFPWTLKALKKLGPARFLFLEQARG